MPIHIHCIPLLLRSDASLHASLTAPQAAAFAGLQRVKLGQLKVATLQRYVEAFDLKPNGIVPSPTHKQLLQCVAEHFFDNTMEVDEAKLLAKLLARRQAHTAGVADRS